jgi:hypothetical protein
VEVDLPLRDLGFEAINRGDFMAIARAFEALDPARRAAGDVRPRQLTRESRRSKATLGIGNQGGAADQVSSASPAAADAVERSVPSALSGQELVAASGQSLAGFLGGVAVGKSGAEAGGVVG